MRTFFLSSFLLLIAGLAAGSAVAQARWPSLDEQLARDRVPAGSALAKLIAENQQFQLLRPEEAHDKVGVPPWLRVLWRKQHPEADYSADNPMGGYPLMIREVHEWLVEHPDLRPGESEPAGQAVTAEKAAEAGPDLRISGPASQSRAESDIRVNYWDPSRIIASANSLGASGLMSMFYSRDGGETWGQSTLPRTPGDSFQSDPAVEWTSDGTAWATAIGVGTSPFVLRLRAFKSTDDGATWVEDAVISGDQQLADKQMVWTDHSDRSPFKDRLYAIWDDSNIVYMNRRTAEGAWGEPKRVSFGETRVAIGADVKTNGAGTVFGFWPDGGNRKIFFNRSVDGGATYSKPVAIARTFDAIATAIPAQNNRGVLMYVTGGAFQSGRKNLVYAAWTDLTGAAGCRTARDEPRGNDASSCKSRIWFARSTNGGQRWSPARMINNGATRNDQFNPWLVVDEATGALGIIYYDTAGEARTTVNIWYQSSFDDGVKWSAPFRVTSVASESSATSAFQFGDYNAFSGIAGTFFPTWTDRRGGFVDEIWTARIRDDKNLTCRTTDLLAEGFGIGAASVAVPEGATETRLSFWHRRQFASGLNSGTLQVSVDGGPAVSVPAAAVLSGAGAAGGEEAIFKGLDPSPVNTVVDLDAVCNAADGGSTGCAGRTLRLFFSASDLPAEKPDRWLLDDVAVTACAR